MIRQLAESTDCQHWRPPSVPVLTSRGGSRLRYGGGGRWRVLHAVSFCWGNATGGGRGEGGLCRKSTVLVGRDWIRTGKFFLKIFPWSKMHQWGTLSEQKSVIYFNWCIWLWAGMHFLGDHSRDQDTQQSLNCKLKNKKSIITDYQGVLGEILQTVCKIWFCSLAAMTQSFYGLQILLLFSVFWLVK